MMCQRAEWKASTILAVVALLALAVLFPVVVATQAPPIRFAEMGVNVEQSGVWAVVENAGPTPLPEGLGWRLWASSPQDQNLVAKGILPALPPGATTRLDVTGLVPGKYRFYLMPWEGSLPHGLWSEEITLSPSITPTSAVEPTTTVPTTTTATPKITAATPYPAAVAPAPTATPYLIALPLVVQPVAPPPALLPPAPTPTRLLPPLAFLAPVAREALPEEFTMPLGSLSGDKALALQGYIPSSAVYYLLEEGVSASAGRLNIRFRHSATLRPDSTLTVKVNRIPVASVRLTEENASGGEIIAEIPSAALTGDTIEIAFSALLRTADDICAILDDESAWVTILPDSEIALKVNRPPFQPNLGRLPYPFVRERAPREQAVLVVLADALDSEDWAAALPLAGYLGRASAWRDLPIYAVRESAFSERLAAGYDLIFIGRNNTLGILANPAVRWPLARGADGAILGPDGAPLTPDVGVVMETASPWDAHRGLLVVTGGTAEALRRAVQALVQPTFPSEARGDYALIFQTPEAAPSVLASGRLTHTLESLGYDDLVMQGVGRQTCDVTLMMPSTMRVNSARMQVRFSHSPFLWQRVSYLNVYVNDMPVKGVYLDKSNEERATLVFDVPGDRFVPGRNVLRFLFDLRLEDWDCRDAEWGRAWGTIHRDTLLTLDLAPGDGAVDLAALPAPYTGGALWVLPNQPSVETMAGTFLLVAQMGRELGEDILRHRFDVANQVPRTELENEHIIVVGLPQDNPILAEVAANLPFPLGASSAVQGAQPAGVVEQIPSPWNARYRLLVISGANDELVGRAAYLLADARQRARLRGEAALVDAEGVVTIVERQTRPTPVLGQAVGTRATPNWVSYALLGALAVLVILIGVAVVRRLAQRGSERRGPRV